MGIDDTQAGVGRAQQIGEIETLARNRVEAIEGGLVRRIERTGGGLTGDQRRRRRDLAQPEGRCSGLKAVAANRSIVSAGLQVDDALAGVFRSAERRVWKACVRPCRSRSSSYPYLKQ